jgi:hypothetical protein
MSPPGKLIRATAFLLLEQLHGPVDLSSSVATIQVGKSDDIIFSPLELTAEVRAEAACPDDAEVELATWSYPGETDEEVQARSVLCRLAVRWWAAYQESHALGWLQTAPEDPWNEEAVASCLFHIKACKYFKWVRSSRILFGKIPNMATTTKAGWKSLEMELSSGSFLEKVCLRAECLTSRRTLVQTNCLLERRF